MKGLKGKVGIVTGASRGIGKAIAKRLVAEGVKVAMVSRSSKMNDAFNEITRQHGQDIGFPFIANVGTIEDVQDMVKATTKRYGKVDILVNNAGVNKPGNTLLTTPEEDFDEVMKVNIKGVFLCSREIAREMVKRKCGNIINISSWVAKAGRPLMSVYSASKAAIMVLTQAMAIELAPYNIRVNSICPGSIDTEMHDAANQLIAEKRNVSLQEMCELELKLIPMARFGMPEEIAASAAFLASDEAQYITGQALSVDGGLEFR